MSHSILKQPYVAFPAQRQILSETSACGIGVEHDPPLARKDTCVVRQFGLSHQVNHAFDMHKPSV